VYPLSGTQFPLGRASQQGFAQELKQKIELIVLYHRVLTGLGGVFIVLQTLVKSGLAFGLLPLLSGLVFLGNGARGFCLQLMQAVEEVAKLMEILIHPQGLLARCLIACDHALAAIGGHADAVEAVILQGSKMGLPGLCRTI